MRSARSGRYGSLRVHYTTLGPRDTFPYLPGGTVRATAGHDYDVTNGSVVWASGSEVTHFMLHVRDDDIPEQDESVFVLLTAVELIEGEQERAGE